MADIKPLILGIQQDDPKLFQALDSLDNEVKELRRLVRILQAEAIPSDLITRQFANNNAALASGLKAGDLFTLTGTNPLRVCVVY